MSDLPVTAKPGARRKPNGLMPNGDGKAVPEGERPALPLAPRLNRACPWKNDISLILDELKFSNGVYE